MGKRLAFPRMKRHVSENKGGPASERPRKVEDLNRPRRPPRCDVRRNKGNKELNKISNLGSGGVLRGKGFRVRGGGVWNRS